jgi:hypothetical protein
MVSFPPSEHMRSSPSSPSMVSSAIVPMMTSFPVVPVSPTTAARLVAAAVALARRVVSVVSQTPSSRKLVMASPGDALRRRRASTNRATGPPQLVGDET